MLRWISSLFAIVSLAFLAACGGGDDEHESLLDVAQNDGRFTVLVEAVQAADLTQTLSQPGPFTVFAPTDDAFAALLNELGISKAQLLADKPLLTSVLTYHVLGAQVPSSEVPLGKPIEPVGGGFFKAEQSGNALVLTDGRNRTSRVVQADVNASNGVIHAIDRVLLPANQNLVETAMATPDLSILVEAVVAADLGSTLSGAGPFTVFAPTNTAFANLLAELQVSKEQLLADKTLLTQVLTYHVVPGLVLKADVPVDTPVATVQGQFLTVGANLAITDQRDRRANIAATDVLASNGVVHVIDKVILPKP